jgi:Esterase-like activity of phytase
VSLVHQIPLRGASGRAISGLPPSASDDVEPAFDLKGAALGIDPSGVDTEGIVALSDGTFWIGDEYGPSLVHVGPEGQVLQRWVPKGLEKALKAADYPVKGVLPAIAARRRISRGFEALAVSPDERWLYLVFQSPLAHPGVAAFKNGRHVRIWKLELATGTDRAVSLSVGRSDTHTNAVSRRVLIVRNSWCPTSFDRWLAPKHVLEKRPIRVTWRDRERG